MDFDDLDEAVAARIEAGDVDEATLAAAGAPEALEATEVPSKPFSGFVPPVMRSRKLPGADHLEGKSAKAFKERPGPFKMYLIVFYGSRDYAATWFAFVNSMPEWVDVVVYERPGHGVRQREELRDSVSEYASDAIDACSEILTSVARGGPCEGAPFAVLGHSFGAWVMAEFVRRARSAFGVEPCCVFEWDMGPPGVKTFSGLGSKLLVEEPQKFLEIWGVGWDPKSGQESLEYQLHDQRLIHDFHGKWEHTFECDIYVWTTMFPHLFNEKYQEARAAGTVEADIDPKILEAWLKRSELYDTSVSQGYIWDYTYEQYEDGWTSLATGSKRCHRVNVEHAMMKFDKSIADEVAKSLLKYIE